MEIDFVLTKIKLLENQYVEKHKDTKRLIYIQKRNNEIVEAFYKVLKEEILKLGQENQHKNTKKESKYEKWKLQTTESMIIM